MYIIKNAWRNVLRAKGRNILIGIIILVLACASCIGLAIRQAAGDAEQGTMENLKVTAQISVDRQAMMQNNADAEGKFDRSAFKGFDSISLSLEEMLEYAEADTVSDFYYTINSALNSDQIEAIQTSNRTEKETSETDDADAARPDMPNDMGGGTKAPDMEGGMNPGGRDMRFGTNGDFTLTGVSGENAMTEFIEGNASVTEGEMFEEGTENYDCIISEELAAYNDLSVGDEITFYNPNSEDETYTLQVTGLYHSEQNAAVEGMFRQSDPANTIYMSYAALKKMTEASESTAEVSENDFGMQISSAIASDISGTYVFDSVDDYNAFSEDVYDMGLSEEYQVVSQDVNNYEQSLVPLQTLRKTAGYFLIVILVIGALILMVLNIFSIRERKYEIGVLTAIGMKKWKVAGQFLTEILIVTLAAVILGAGIGSVSSVPVANALLSGQIASEQERESSIEQSFGRDRMPEGGAPGQMQEEGGHRGGPFMEQAGAYISEIKASVNLTVLAELLAICIGLALVAGAASVITIMRYEPLKILSNRD